MKFTDQINRVPRAYDPNIASELHTLFADQPEPVRGLLAGAGGSSPFLNQGLRQEADWLRDVLTLDADKTLESLLANIADIPAADLARILRLKKRRIGLLSALADLGGLWRLEQVTGALTRFADASVDACVKTLVAAEIDRGKLPDQTDADKKDAAGMTVLAMGKMGAGELNYSSDIDLICLFDETRFDPQDYAAARSSFVRVTRRLTSILSEMTGDGYVFRTDLRLRPDPSVTPVCLSMETALQYYESVGRTWERAAHIKARPCGGDIDAGNRYLLQLRPFIWRKHLDFAAIQDAHDMRLRIREHKGLSRAIALEGHDMKLGAGGIREIEFFTQTRQIISGGRDASLRERATVTALQKLTDKGWVPADVSETLCSDYRAHRETEHRLQMINDAQTHDLPKSEEGFERLAALSGKNVDEMRSDIAQRLRRVAEHTEGFFARHSNPNEAVAVGPAMQETLARWRTYPSLRSARSTEIFDRLIPDILTRLQKAASPEQALIQFDAFLSGLPGGVQVFSLFQANPQLIDLMVDIAATAPGLARYLGRNAQVFDAVIGGDFFAPWPGGAALATSFENSIGVASGYEAKLDAARRVMKEWHFRIGVHHLRGLIDPEQAGEQYSNLADATVAAIWPEVVREFSRKHGPLPGRGAAVLAMGSLGSEMLTAASDLDLIMIYDPEDTEVSEGRRPLATRAYYARLTQALVTALSAQMSEGRLYEVDMRLRPSGRQGPVATAFKAYVAYQRDEAWTWEHLALTRARPIVGNPQLAAEIDAFRGEILAKNRDRRQIVNDVIEMRHRLAAAKPLQSDWDAKSGPGRMQDISLIAQTAALLAGDTSRHVPAQIKAGGTLGWLSEEQASVLIDAYRLMWKLQAAARLLTGDVLDLDEIGQGGIAFLLRETDTVDVDALAASVQATTAAAGTVIDTLLGNPGEHPAPGIDGTKT